MTRAEREAALMQDIQHTEDLISERLSERARCKPKWQPIETAPKDGTHILAYGRGTDKCMWPASQPMPLCQVVIYWSWHDDEELVEVESGLFKKVPKRVLEMWKPFGPHFFHPTHWMPLPEPPTLNASET